MEHPRRRDSTRFRLKVVHKCPRRKRGGQPGPLESRGLPQKTCRELRKIFFANVTEITFVLDMIGHTGDNSDQDLVWTGETRGQVEVSRPDRDQEGSYND